MLYPMISAALVMTVSFSLNRCIDYSEVFNSNRKYRMGILGINCGAIVLAVAVLAVVFQMEFSVATLNTMHSMFSIDANPIITLLSGEPCVIFSLIFSGSVFFCGFIIVVNKR